VLEGSSAHVGWVEGRMIGSYRRAMMQAPGLRQARWHATPGPRDLFVSALVVTWTPRGVSACCVSDLGGRVFGPVAAGDQPPAVLPHRHPARPPSQGKHRTQPPARLTMTAPRRPPQQPMIPSTSPIRPRPPACLLLRIRAPGLRFLASDPLHDCVVLCALVLSDP
jgi:hypothetical protein